MEFALPHAAASPMFGKALIAIFFCLMLTVPVLAASSAGIDGFAAEQPGRTLSQTILRQDLDAFFSRRADRVVPYADWTYGWATSYANSYVTAARVLSALWNNPGAWPENVVGAVRTQQVKSVTEHVLRPEHDAAELEALVNRHAASRMFILEMETLSASCAGASGPACRDVLAPKSLLHNRAI